MKYFKRIRSENLRENIKLNMCRNLQNKLWNITVLFILYLLVSLKKMSLAKHGELYFILASTCFSPLAILASVWKKWFPTLLRYKSFKSCTFNACKWPRWAKNKTYIQNFSLKINRLNQLIMKLACLVQHRRKHKPK